ncbi:MAG: type II toxin-antitoxin system VapC family toxin [Anaerolineae bacterium]|jgi:tRNA(fMet)-specific endonuclease VapC|nr:type II toxin-antitoxin system VapC family toxin [Anaerolineae bacterium]
MSFLLDTCVISELVARQPNPAVVQWVDSVDENMLFLSAITIGEIKRGIEKLPDSSRKSALEDWLEDDLLIRFRDKILSIDAAVMLVWGQLAADLEKQGKPMPAVDSLIAATCLQGKLDLVTRNESDFVHSGVTVINPWTP